MENTRNLSEQSLADAWTELQARADQGEPLQPHANRLAFADPEFLLRRETRGVRMQLEMLKPDIEQARLGIEHTVVVFGSARFVALDVAQAALQAAQASGDAGALRKAERDVRNARWYEEARQFAHLVARSNAHLAGPDARSHRLYIATGGGPGVMEAANRGASEAGQPTVGLNIALPHEQHPNPYITPELSFKFHYFALRKMHFMMRAKALVAFPGGFGTLDELFEVMTLVQTRKAKPVPIVLYGSDYWKSLINFSQLVEMGAISPEDVDLVQYADTPQAAWDCICNFYKLTVMN
jgi:uncharacterized protein (TIGR00730 family)